MALTAREYAERLRTIGRSGSKAPLQNVQLPTNQSRYQTPSMKSTSPGTAEMQGKTGANPAMLAKAGGILGKIGKQWGEAQRAKDVLGGLQGADMGINMTPLPEVGILGGLAEANQGIVNTPLPSALGSGTPKVAGTVANAVPGADVLGGLANAGAVDAATNANNVLGGLAEANQGIVDGGTGSMMPGVGTAASMGLDLASGNVGRAGATAAGAAIGSAVPVVGTAMGGMLGGQLYNVFNGLWR